VGTRAPSLRRGARYGSRKCDVRLCGYVYRARVVGADIDESFALHTRARRHLIDRYRELTSAYSALTNSGRAAGGYTETALQIFPRYNVVDAILIKVEELDSDDLPAVGELTRLLVEAAHEAQSPFTRPREVLGAIPGQVMADERRLFADRVAELACETDAIEALPYRRTLSDVEGDRWLDSLQQRWGVVNLEWYPMLDVPVPDEVLVLQQEGIFKGGGDAATRTALVEMCVGRVIELREDVAHREIDVDWFSPTYTASGEGLWTDESRAWIVYASHENTVAFGGSIRPYLLASWSGIDRWRWRGWQ
jgi:hypothetical protein